MIRAVKITPVVHQCLHAAREKPTTHKVEACLHTGYFVLVALEGKELPFLLAFGMTGITAALAVYTITMIFIPGEL